MPYFLYFVIHTRTGHLIRAYQGRCRHMIGMHRIGTDIVQTVELTVQSQIEGFGRIDINAHLYGTEERNSSRKRLNGGLEVVHHLLLQSRIHLGIQLKKYDMFHHSRLFFVVSVLIFLFI